MYKINNKNNGNYKKAVNYLYIIILILLQLFNFAKSQEQYMSSFGKTIPVALLTDKNTEVMEMVFDAAIEEAENKLEVRLQSIKETISYGDSFGAYGKLQEIIQTGVAGVFGPSSQESVAHLSTYCDRKDTPFLYSNLRRDIEGFNLFPHPKDLANALYATLGAYEWTEFIILYESADYLIILNELLDLYGVNIPFITVYRYDINMDNNYRPMLRRIRKSVINQIVVLGSSDTIPELLKQAQQVGIITKTYKYIITNLDFQSFQLSEFKFGESNITSFRMFSTTQTEVQNLLTKLNSSYANYEFHNGLCPITLEAALLYDAVQLFAEATKHIPLQLMPENCADGNDCVLNDGSSLKNFMRTMVFYEGTLTGDIYFEGNVRKGFELDVVELQPSGIVKVATWNEEEGYISKRLTQTNTWLASIDNSLANKTFKILLSMTKPYASLVESHKRLEGNNQYEGYCVELIKELAEKLGFNFTLIDGGYDYGQFNLSTNVSTGMLRQIIEGEADLIVTDLTITSERQEVLDFTIPFMNLGIAILYLKPQVAPPSLFSFMAPLSIDVWVYLGLSFIATSLSFFLLGRLSPAEWDNPFPCIVEPVEFKNQFTIGNSLWFTTGALLQQGSEIGPKALSTRAVASIWWFFTLIMVNSYTANLAAFLTVTMPTTIIDNVQDLAEHKGGVVFGAKDSGATRKFFANTEDETYRAMNDFMVNHPQYLVKKNEEGVKRVKESKNYAFLMESTSIDYNTMRECNLKKIGDALDEKGYGIAMRKDWPYRSKFNEALLQLQEQGTLEKMKNKWWNEVGAGICTTKNEQSEASELNMDNLGGVYYVLIVGTALALLYGIFNWLSFVLSNARRIKEPWPICFKREFKFLIDIHEYTREF